MIRGQVSADKEAMIPLQLRGAQGQVETIQAVVDTGFTGALALPSAMVARLGMPFRMMRPYELGDGNVVDFDIHEATIVWDGQDRPMEALVTAGGALAGMSSLIGHHLFIDVIDGGEVRIEPRP
jgi:clan AA aspartic protease